MKKCSKCQNVLENQNTKVGSYCRACRNEYNKAHYKRNPNCRKAADKANTNRLRQRTIEAKSKPCVDCGIQYPPYVMDFDHVRGKKKILLSLAATSHVSAVRWSEEIAKCDIVCANCHRERTFQRACRLTGQGISLRS